MEQTAAGIILRHLNEARQRSRLIYAVLVLVFILFGLASRKFSWLLPDLLQKNAGDILWAVMVFFLCGLLFPRLSTLRITIYSLLFSAAIEFLKLYQAPWLNAVRSLPGARLVVGYAFSWSNLLCYLLGILLGAAGEVWTSALSTSRKAI